MGRRPCKLTISILVPCFNEAITIEKCLNSWLNQTHPANQIIIVDDGSTDNSLEILKKYKNKVKIIENKHLGNKSLVQEVGLKYVKGDVFITTDADTLMHKDFVRNVYNAFKNPKVQAFAGYVKSLEGNWLTACREIEYTIYQDIHKEAQYKIDSIIVIPGCAGAFRTNTFKSFINFDHDTLTEDLDFTYKLNKNGQKIIYDQNAIVFTQDPSNLVSYIKQIKRWFCGGYQNLVKHLKGLKKPNLILEVSLTYSEGIFFSLLFLLAPLFNLQIALQLNLVYLLYDIIVGSYASIKRKRIDLFIYSPFLLVLNYINAGVFLEQFISVVVFRNKNRSWIHPERRLIA